MEPLVSVNWLQENLARPDLIILEAALPTAVSAAQASRSQDANIRGSVRVDLDHYFADENAPFPHTLANPEKFSKDARALGINNAHTIVVYDKFGIYASPRLRLAFKAMGHDRIAVLDGGLPAWQAAGFSREPDDTHEPRAPGNFIASYRADVFCNAAFVSEAMHSPDHALIDARSAARFKGIAPEPRAGLRSGHIPGAFNVPFDSVLDQGCMRPTGELRLLFERISPLSKQFVFSCGSGVTACVPALAAEIVGVKHIKVYDGSWSEWGARNDLPVSTD